MCLPSALIMTDAFVSCSTGLKRFLGMHEKLSICKRTLECLIAHWAHWEGGQHEHTMVTADSGLLQLVWRPSF